MPDCRLGLILRALRRRRGWRQSDVGARVGVSPSVVSRAERGHLDSLSLRTLRALFAAVDARYEGNVRWRGGELDYLVDAAHASLGVAVAGRLSAAGWGVMPEVTFARLGERGSIDILGLMPAQRAAAAVELKSELTSLEETLRRLDAKARVAASVVEERLGWRPVMLGVILVLADTSTNRARVRRVAPLIRGTLPAGNVELRQWLSQPSGNVRGIWFVRDMAGGTAKRRVRTSHRVRARRSPDRGPSATLRPVHSLSDQGADPHL